MKKTLVTALFMLVSMTAFADTYYHHHHHHHHHHHPVVVIRPN